jgi:hypothetical protein
MKHLILLLLILLSTGCTSFRNWGDSLVTTSSRAMVFGDQRATDPLGYFTIRQDRWAYDTQPGSDVGIEFVNTTNEILSFNFTLTGVGFRIKDAVVSLPPGETYHTKRYFCPYNAVDHWSVTVDADRISRVKK